MIKQISMIISQYCNLRCPFCLSNSGINIQNEVPVEDLISFLDKFPNLEMIKITGGEALSDKVYSRTYKVCKYAESRNIKMQINTNGTFDIPDFDIRKDIVEFQVSIDGPKNIHDLIRGEGAFDKTSKFIRYLISEGYSFHTMSVINNMNYSYLEQLSDTLDELEIKDRRAQIVSNSGRAKDTVLNFDIRAVLKEISKLGIKCRYLRGKCHSMLSYKDGFRIAIDTKGNIIPCPYLMEYKYGTIYDFSENRVREQMRHICGVTCNCKVGY